jgi:hypothetical protein
LGCGLTRSFSQVQGRRLTVEISDFKNFCRLSAFPEAGEPRDRSTLWVRVSDLPWAKSESDAICPGNATAQRHVFSLPTDIAAAAPQARLSPAFRSALRKRIQCDPEALWPDFSPDVVHLVACALVVALLVFLLPFPSRSVILGGLVFTSGTYFLQAALRGALSGLEADT